MQNREKKRKNRKTDSTAGMILAFCILLLVFLNLIMPDRELSEQENRMLMQKPRLTWNGLISGDFMEKYESWMADQFVGRDMWRSIKVTLNRFGGSKEEEGVLIGKNQQLMETIVSPEQATLNENLSAIKKFVHQNQDVPVYMMLVPDSATVLKDKLPSFATVADQNRMFAQVKRELTDSVIWLDAAGALNQHKEEKIYYQTDHHWTSLGAFYTFGAVAEQMNLKVDSASLYVSYPVSTTFNGMLAAKSGCRTNIKEEIDIYVPRETDNDVVVNYVDEQRRTTSLYDSSKLKTRDQYAVFLGGNSSVIDIKTVSESQRRLLIIKDSFANCFIPFLTPHFREIVVVDPRYYSGTMDTIMDTYPITDVLILYSGNTFFQDNNISGVIGSE